MKSPQRPFTKAAMTSATTMASMRVASILKMAQRMSEDSDRAARVAAQCCIACHYTQRIGGSAMTSQPCSCCGVDQMYSSTATDATCQPCAKEHDLCKHCGGDIDMRTGRRKWPEPPAKEQQNNG